MFYTIDGFTYWTWADMPEGAVEATEHDAYKVVYKAVYLGYETMNDIKDDFNRIYGGKNAAPLYNPSGRTPAAVAGTDAAEKEND